MSEYHSFLMVERHHHMHESQRAYVNAVAARNKKVVDAWKEIGRFHDGKVEEYTLLIDRFK